VPAHVENRAVHSNVNDDLVYESACEGKEASENPASIEELKRVFWLGMRIVLARNGDREAECRW